jgi:hypothetical protein
MISLFSLARYRVHYHCSPRMDFHFGSSPAIVPCAAATDVEHHMLGFYEEMADFAAMSEDAGYLGQCATEIAELFRGDERTVSAPCEGGLLRARSRQLQLLVIEDDSRRP